MTSSVLRTENISKSFAGVRALDDVSLDAAPGEVIALLGENGAGKSTLLRILSGDYTADAGRIVLGGEEVSFRTPAQAQAAGVRVIYQEPEIIPHVSVAENVYVGALGTVGRVFKARALAQRLEEDLDRLGFSGMLRPETLGSRLSPAQRQLVEILRALTGEPRLIAFDEPTSSLSDHEVNALFRLIGRLREEGKAVIYVSHRLREIFEVADRVAVLRDGKLVGVVAAGETNEDELVRMMVGRSLENMFTRPRHPTEQVVLDVRGVTTDDVRDVSLQVRAGEVVALAGLVGAGRSEFARAIVGDVPLHAGEVSVGGRAIHLHSPADAVHAGIGFAPEERKADALFLERGVRDNVSIALLDQLSRFHIVRRAAERRLVRTFTDQLRVRTPSLEQEVRKLSGGNQQKVVLARWLARRPKVLILDEPTRGVDVGAKAEIYAIISELAQAGVAILVISSELPEVLGLADRIVVMQGGRVTGELGREEATEERILALAIHDHLARESAA
jgi:L-arabinose transport system ATP-binding protein